MAPRKEPVPIRLEVVYEPVADTRKFQGAITILALMLSQLMVDRTRQESAALEGQPLTQQNAR